MAGDTTGVTSAWQKMASGPVVITVSEAGALFIGESPS